MRPERRVVGRLVEHLDLRQALAFRLDGLNLKHKAKGENQSLFVWEDPYVGTYRECGEKILVLTWWCFAVSIEWDGRERGERP